MRLVIRKLHMRGWGEGGFMLIESLVALALLGALSLAFLSGLATTSRANIVTDELTTGESLARSQMEWITNVDYASQYSPPVPTGDIYTGYSTVVTAEPLHQPDDGIQKITVVVNRVSKEVFWLEGYKVNR